MAAAMLQVIPNFYTNYSKDSAFICAKTYEKIILSKERCITNHDDKMCFLPNCRYHIVLLERLKSCLKKGLILVQLATRGFSVYKVEVSILWQNCCHEWTTLWYSAEAISF